MRYALMLTLLLAVSLTALGTTRAQVTSSAVEPISLTAFKEARQSLLSKVNFIRKTMGKPRRHFSNYANQIPASRRDENLGYWRGEVRQARTNRVKFWKTKNATFHRSLRWATAKFGVSYNWLHACDHHEGSDRMVWNGGVVDPGLAWYPYGPPGSSGAYGPMQFMRGTFTSFARHGISWLRTYHGIRVNKDRYYRWNSNLGQAIGAAWAFRHGYSSHWTGAAC